MKGSRPPPCSGFSLTMIDEEHAVMFGGSDSSYSGVSADVYVLHLPTMVSGLLLCIMLDLTVHPFFLVISDDLLQVIKWCFKFKGVA